MPYPQFPAPPVPSVRRRPSPVRMIFLIPLLLGFAWLIAYYFYAGNFVFMYRLGAWHFLIGLSLILIGVIGAIGARAVVKAPVAFVGPYNPQTSSLSIVALVLGFVFPFAAIPIGHIARAQIRATGEQGDGLALTGLVLGYLWLTFLIAAVVAVVATVH
ncbi:cell division protein CrgA [Nocardia seriolae]|nr:cell division protein CrgA [Nocardia seriolae]